MESREVHQARRLLLRLEFVLSPCRSLREHLASRATGADVLAMTCPDRLSIRFAVPSKVQSLTFRLLTLCLVLSRTIRRLHRLGNQDGKVNDERACLLCSLIFLSA